MTVARAARGGSPGADGVGFNRVLSKTTLITTDATLTQIASVACAQNTTANLAVWFSAWSNTSNVGATWVRWVGVERALGNVALITASVMGGFQAKNTTLNAATVVFSVSGGNLLLQVQGIAANNISWSVVVYQMDSAP